MMGQEFGLALDEIGEMLLQHRRDPSMQFLPPGAQQGAVGGVLHQRVLEEIGGGGTTPRQNNSPASASRSSPDRSSAAGRCATCSIKS